MSSSRPHSASTPVPVLCLVFLNSSRQLLPRSLTLSCCLMHYDLCYCSRLPLIVFKTGLVYTGKSRPFRIVDLPTTMTIDAFHMRRLRKGNTANQNREKNSKWSRLRSDVAGVVVNDTLLSLTRILRLKQMFVNNDNIYGASSKNPERLQIRKDTLISPHTLTHTHTHTRTHARTHAHTHARTHTKNIHYWWQVGRMRRKKKTGQCSKEKKWVFSSDW